MTHQLINLFPTLVTRTSAFLNEEQCAEVFEYLKKVKMYPHGTVQGGKSSHKAKGEDIFNDIANTIKSCMNIRYEVLDALNKYSVATGIVYTDISNSWANIQDEGSTLAVHTHPLSALSGALYINVDEHSSKLSFYNPNPFVTFTQHSSTGSDYVYDSYWLNLNKGDLIIFPSWLRHGSYGVNKTKDRTVISFNAW